MKHGRSFFGYKQHVRVDAKTELKARAKVRSRVEHVFEFMKRS